MTVFSYTSNLGRVTLSNKVEPSEDTAATGSSRFDVPQCLNVYAFW
jgi:hypothetical protein